MLEITKKTREVSGYGPTSIPEDVIASSEPVVLRGLVKDWSIVRTALSSDGEVDAYLRGFYNGKTVGAFFGSPDIEGRFFYNEDVTELNFEFRRVPLDSVLDQIQQHRHDERPPSFYVGSTSIDACLPGFRAENDLALDADHPLVSIWIGNRSRIACHYDAPKNIACSVAGKRRFILFPPDQIANLYPGPLDFTPAGQAVSMVDFSRPDFERYPRFRHAIEAGQVAEMEPGDALYIPSMWWHHVEGLSPLNVLVNYWWRAVPDYMGPGVNVLKHALLGLRDLPEDEKAAWRHIFDYYVFGEAEQAGEHLPEQARGVLAPVDDLNARRLRAHLINRLNR